MKQIFISALIMLFVKTAFTHTKDIKDLYWDYVQVRMGHASQSAKAKALNLLSHASEFNQNQHYERVIKSVPGYYVAHRALGIIELKEWH